MTPEPVPPPKSSRSRSATRSVRRPERLAALLVLGLLVVLLVLVNGLGWVALRRLHNMLENDLENRLITTGQTVAATLNAEDFLILSFRDDNGALDLNLIRQWRGDASYTALIHLLERVKTAADLRSISLVLPDGRVVADPDDVDLVGETRPLLFLDTPEMKAAAKGKPAAGPLYPVDNVLYKRVYVPLFDENHKVLALLRLEASSDYFLGLERMRASLTVLLIVSTAVLLVVSLVLYRLINRLLLTERAASQADRLRSLGTLAAGLAHEIRNPLAIIRLTCEELRADLKASAPGGTGEAKGESAGGGARSGGQIEPVGYIGRRGETEPVGAIKPAPTIPNVDSPEKDSPTTLIKDIQEEVTRLESLVEQFLAFARPEASQSALTAGRPAEPVAAVRNIARLFERSLRATKIRLKTLLPDEPLHRVWLSEKGLSQVLLNILRNATEAMSVAGGTVTLTVRELTHNYPEGESTEAGSSSQESTKELSVKPGEARIEIAVEDTGPGMPESVRRQAFEPFFSTKENGTGLGLALVLRLVNAAGGDVELETRAGKGTIVRVLLPVVGISRDKRKSVPGGV